VENSSANGKSVCFVIIIMEKKDERSDQTEGASRANLGTGKSNKVYEGTDE